MASVTASMQTITETLQKPMAALARGDANVGDIERLACVAAGGALGIYGLSRGSLGGGALALLGGALLYRGLTGHCHLYQALGLNTREKHGPATSVPAGRGIKVEKVITINRPADELYRYWRQLENLPCFMSHLESVRQLNTKRSHWLAKGPLGTTVAWDAEIITDKPGRTIAWRSLQGSEVDTAGSVHFTPLPGNRGTEVRVVLKYDPPAGKVGAMVAKMLGEAPERQIEEDLRHFKQITESGELPTAGGQAECARW